MPQETKIFAISHTSSRRRRTAFSPAKPALAEPRPRPSQVWAGARPPRGVVLKRSGSGRREMAGSGEMQMQIPCPHPRPDSAAVRRPDKRLPRDLTCVTTNHWRIEGGVQELIKP